ncbi:CapA family protein [Waltera sp.]|jgi:poly-gamma-glutamate capsule biosynthesis protein CapA/YwtB (metallophosphatase superfamily)
MLFQGISPFLNAADIRIINQETVMGGNSRGFSGFPYFNSPTEVGDAIADAGFNVVLQASNHTADQKLDGLLYCADFWKNKHPEVLVTGIHEDASQADDIPLLTIDDVTFAILNYTYGANTETLPLDLLGHLNLLCAVNEKNGQMDFTTLNPQVLEDISRAKELADIVIVCPHWGTEYSSKISSYQEKWALEMTEAGADVIIGTHPHVVEPVEWITAENGNESLCYYSLGNYVSTQKNALSMLEGMAWLTFHVAEDGVSIERKTTGVIPLVCQYTSGPVRFENVYLLEEYTEELAASHGIRNYAGVVLHLEDLQKWSDEILGDFVLTKDQALHNFKTDSINQ